MRRQRIQTLALALIWVGGIETSASFLARVLFQFTIQWTPLFFLALLIGIALFILTRII
ncbi:MAG: hypothetical protein K6T83_18980 [Alicyclobacillus sp.]|nr:hypothetical protein [Alicyclobacillus sp.]